MHKWLAVILVATILITSGAAVVSAQGGGSALPPCTEADLQGILGIALDILRTTGNASRFEVADMLGWREEIAALEIPACAEADSIRLQLRLANDELLIGALLLERGEALDTAAAAINEGLAALVGLRYALSGRPAAQSEVFGGLSGDDVLAIFEEIGLPVADVVRDAGPAGGDAPHTESERITFTLPTVFDGGVGQILIFADEASRDAWLAYLYGPEVAEPGYVLLHRNVIVQLSAELDQAAALQFRAALQNLE